MKWIAVMFCVLLGGAGPATKPATTVYELRKEVESLRAELDELRTEVVTLREQVEKAQPTSRPVQETKAGVDADPIALGIRDHNLVIGMTLEQAEQALKTKGKRVYTNDTGTSEYTWPIYEVVAVGQAGGFNPREINASGVRRQTGEIKATFVGGKIKAISKW